MNCLPDSCPIDIAASEVNVALATAAVGGPPKNVDEAFERAPFVESFRRRARVT